MGLRGVSISDLRGPNGEGDTTPKDPKECVVSPVYPQLQGQKSSELSAFAL
jgi:hypothetical protein